jgi:hypothetical protein
MQDAKHTHQTQTDHQRTREGRDHWEGSCYQRSFRGLNRVSLTIEDIIEQLSNRPTTRRNETSPSDPCPTHLTPGSGNPRQERTYRQGKEVWSRRTDEGSDTDQS